MGDLVRRRGALAELVDDLLDGRRQLVGGPNARDAPDRVNVVQPMMSARCAHAQTAPCEGQLKLQKHKQEFRVLSYFLIFHHELDLTKREGMIRSSTNEILFQLQI